MDDLQRQRELRLVRDEILSTPNCPDCLHPMEPAQSAGTDVWRCTSCERETE
ncbi:zf-TFIIB domain-containing protein [Microbacterium sp. M]|uniref:zf-TFIIB domain-containing protein n=1 Tax=Microbacterium sp. M TaxID=3377125 RepID=UPI003867607A